MNGLELSVPLTILMVFSIGAIGYLIFKYFRIPGGAITGSLAMVALVSAQGIAWAKTPSYICTFFQIIIGIMVGCKFSKEKTTKLKLLIIPGLLVSIWMLCTGFFAGVILTRITGIDLATSLYGSVPGGIAEMGLIALSYNLSVPVVSLFQFVRVMAIHLIVPPIAMKYSNPRTEELSCGSTQDTDETLNESKKTFGVITTLIFGGIGGFIATKLGIPVGGTLGAMIVVGVMRSIGVPLKQAPHWLTIVAQVGLGGFLGTTFTIESAITLKGMFFSVFIFSIIIVMSGIVLGFVVHHIFGWDLATSLLACSAAGVTQMSVIALDMKADAITVGLIQAMRLALIVMLMPSIIKLFIRV